MKNKKNTVFITITLLFLLLFINNSHSVINFEVDTNLTNNIKKNIANDCGVEFNYSNNNTIYGSLFNSKSNTTFLETVGLFSYNTISKEYVHFDYNEKNRIINYYINGETIYYIKIIEKNNLFYWELLKSDLDFKNNFVIKNGKIEDPFTFPRILFNDREIFLLSINDVNADKQEYNIDLITKDDKLVNLINETGFKNNGEGNLLYNIHNAYLDKNIIYYSIVDNNNTQHLVSYNLVKKKKESIYTNMDKNMIIYNFKKVGKGMYLQLALKNEDNMSYFIYIENDRVIKKTKTEIKTLDTVVDGGLVFHNEGNKFEFFSDKNLRLKNYKVSIDEIYPKYLIVNNLIYIQDFSNNFYKSNFIDKYL